MVQRHVPNQHLDGLRQLTGSRAARGVLGHGLGDQQLQLDGGVGAKYPQRGSEHYRPTLVKEGASIGANASVVCGNTIGRHALIGAGAVVTRDVCDHALMLGAPAERVGWVCECGQVLPQLKDAATCPRCGLKYRVEGERLSLDV